MIDHFSLLPHDPMENVRWRLRMRKRALKDVLVQKAVRQACWDDPCFFFEAMLWCLETRAAVKMQPFVLWPHQVEAVRALEQAIDDSCRSMEDVVDVLMDKSRAQGGTLINSGVMTRRFLRDRRFSGALMSRNMDLVDNPEDPDSLMSKIDFNLKLLPFWMRPVSYAPKADRLISKSLWRNADKLSSIVGWAATGDAGRGGRKTFVFFDEVAFFDSQKPGMTQDALDSTQHVTNCRSLCSTHNGDSGPFYDAVYNDHWMAAGKVFPLGGSGVYKNASGSVKIVLDWRDNPVHSRLAYRFLNGQFTAERPHEVQAVAEYVEKIKKSGEWNKLERRGFVKPGEVRSPWYDKKCLQKGATARGIARECDRDPRGSVGKLFPPKVMDEVGSRKCQPPLWQGGRTR